MIAMHLGPGRDGDRAKLEAHALLEARRELYVLRGRRALLGALLLAGTATADDVRASVELPDGINPKLFGAVPGALARAGIIRAAGFVNSTRAAGHARPVKVWELADYPAAHRWLAEHPDRPDPATPIDYPEHLFNARTQNAGGATPAF
jgi:hypothetical protein